MEKLQELYGVSLFYISIGYSFSTLVAMLVSVVSALDSPGTPTAIAA